MTTKNFSCFASKVPVKPGQTCYLVPIAQQHSVRMLALDFQGEEYFQLGLPVQSPHPHQYWAPLSGFLEAVVTEEGSFELKDTNANRLRTYTLVAELFTRTPLLSATKNTSFDALDIKDLLHTKAPTVLAMVQGSKSADALNRVEGTTVVKELALVVSTIVEQSNKGSVFVTHENAVRPLTFAMLSESSYKELVRLGQLGNNDEGHTLDLTETLKRATNAIKVPGRLRSMLSKFGARAPVPKNASPEVVYNNSIQENLNLIGNLPELLYPSEEFEVPTHLAAYKAREIDTADLWTRLTPVFETRLVVHSLDQLGIRIEPLQPSGPPNASSYQQFLAAVATHS